MVVRGRSFFIGRGVAGALHRPSMKKTIYINGNCCLAKLTPVARFICHQLHLMVLVYKVIVTRVCMISKKNVKIIREILISFGT